MKIKVTEIECTSEEIRQSNNLAEGIHNLLRGVFNGIISDDEMTDCEDREDGEKNEYRP